MGLIISPIIEASAADNRQFRRGAKNVFRKEARIKFPTARAKKGRRPASNVGDLVACASHFARITAGHQGLSSSQLACRLYCKARNLSRHTLQTGDTFTSAISRNSRKILIEKLHGGVNPQRCTSEQPIGPVNSQRGIAN